MNEISPMSRRGFMAGAAAAGAAALFTIAGCSPATEKPASTTAEPTFDKEVDIVVAGSGTGAFAALAAADLGAESVVLLEKGSHFGGTASFSGAAFGGMYTHVLPDMGSPVTADDMFETNVHLDDWRCNREVVRALVDNSNDFQLWTEDKLGFTWGIPSALYADYQYVVAIDGEATDMYNSASLWVTLRQYV
ncbi:MAG: FAD-binding protein, partial [Eggerthellaceae bacterium]|nr:FAD-binding protein [Eggerthellaceae bacterium]